MSPPRRAPKRCPRRVVPWRPKTELTRSRTWPAPTSPRAPARAGKVPPSWSVTEPDHGQPRGESRTVTSRLTGSGTVAAALGAVAGSFASLPESPPAHNAPVGTTEESNPMTHRPQRIGSRPHGGLPVRCAGANIRTPQNQPPAGEPPAPEAGPNATAVHRQRTGSRPRGGSRCAGRGEPHGHS